MSPAKTMTIYLGLGANLGDREQNLNKALSLLAGKMDIDCVSSFYDTAPVGYSDQPRFLNAVCRGKAALSPMRLFRLVKNIERVMGRAPTFRNGPRVIDIDILFCDGLVLNKPLLEIPHPRIAERAFVLAPLAEIEPGLVHPVLGKTIAEMLSALGSAAGDAVAMKP